MDNLRSDSESSKEWSMGEEGRHEMGHEPSDKVQDCRVFGGMLFAVDLDPLEILKDPEAVPPRDGNSLEGIMGSLVCTKRDQRRAIFAKCNRIFQTYLLAKGMLMGAVQTFLLEHEIYEKFLMSNKSSSAVSHNGTLQTSGRFGLHKPPTQTPPREPLIGRELLQAVSEILGNPLAHMGDLSLYVYVGVTATNFLRAILLPIYHHSREHKLNMSYLRFLFKPRLEQRRLDLVARSKLDGLNQSLVNYANDFGCMNVLGSSRKATTSPLRKTIVEQLRLGRRGHLRRGTSVFVSAEQLAALGLKKNCKFLLGLVQDLDNEPGKCRDLRPHTFHLEWHEFICPKVRLVANSIMGIFIFWYAIFTLITYHFSRGSLSCTDFYAGLDKLKLNSLTDMAELAFGLRGAKALHDEGSNPTTSTTTATAPPPPPPTTTTTTWEAQNCRQFSKSEILFTVELTLAAMFCMLAEANHMVICIVNIASQIHLIRSMRHELMRCQQELLVHCELGLHHGDRSLERDRFLVEQFAKSAIFETELTDGFRALSRQNSIYLFHIVGLAAFMFITSHLQTPISAKLRVISLVLIWLWLNSLALLCCYIHARFLGLGERYWSILAQLTLIQANDSARRVAEQRATAKPVRCWPSEMRWARPPNHGRELAERLGPALPNSQADPLANCTNSLAILKQIWQKFVLAMGTNIDHYCVRPLGVRLNYSRLIELNFMFVFIYSLTWSTNQQRNLKT